ncbi:hypothetical protein DPMN_058327 [Dreissena polymorpha]|uniref:Uncharacterized protein n=1 Tax=Dreissena polymorpha TaxID=45954 RepID=A0A9D4C1T7_DREPO|nr:hypothetical protein DPMN_058327 [Dreissena polymorpha]
MVKGLPVTGLVKGGPVAGATWSRTVGEKSRQAELSLLRQDAKELREQDLEDLFLRLRL